MRYRKVPEKSTSNGTTSSFIERIRLMVLQIEPQRGFLRPFGLGWFIKEFLSGSAPCGSAAINPFTGTPQADIFYYYKKALIMETAMDRAIRAEERKAKKEKRRINPDRIDEPSLVNFLRTY
jgi:hypothetical protein